MKELSQQSGSDPKKAQDAPGYAWLLVTGLLLAFIFLPIVVA